MFKKFETVHVVKEAFEVLESDEIKPSSIVGCSVLYRGNESIIFAHSEPVVKAGDYIIKQSAEDVYHCPRKVFMEKYREPAVSGLTFGEAIEAAKEGKKIARAGWNGKSMFLVLTSNIEFETKADLSFMDAQGVDAPNVLVIYTPEAGFTVGYTPIQSHCLADDWCIVE